MADNYLDIDFSTYRQMMEDLLKSRDTFKDYDYEGSNISILLELIAYQLELNTYYQNKIAKNVYLESADLYNTVHRLSKQKGYYPKGYISSYTTLTVTVSSGYTPGDQLYVPSYTSFSTEDDISYLTTTDTTINVPVSASALSYSFDLDVKEGELESLEYTAEDLIDYKLILPDKDIDHDNNDSNDHETIKVLVNDTKWTRLDNFYENLSLVDLDDDVYVFEYDKDKLYTVSFTNTRSYPSGVDTITVYCIISNGADGKVGANTITSSDSDFVENITTSATISNDNVSFTNASASSNGADPEIISTIKGHANNIFNSQYRCVTKNDYISYIETMSNVNAASVWGEQEETQNGNTQEYNKVHISVIPNEWDTSTISTTTSAWAPVDDSISISIPSAFSQTLKDSISDFVEPREMLNVFKQYDMPELVYFYFEIALKIKSTYNFANVSRDVKNKIVYYFNSLNRDFNETIDFRDIKDNIIDSSIVSSDDSFSLVKGISSLEFRDFYISKNVYNYGSNNYPVYMLDDFDINVDNIIRPIKLGYNQFPAINENLIIISNEG